MRAAGSSVGMKLPNFPEYAHFVTREKIDDVVRLAELDLTKSEFVNGNAAKRLIDQLLESFVAASKCTRWTNDEFITRTPEDQRLSLFMAAIFDIVCNAEYLHERVTNAKWIYCNRSDKNGRRAYLSFLQQCPSCSLDVGLSKRLEGAQHKPSSHHIGEISTTITALMLQRIFAATKPSLRLATITKQSHDVDLIAYCKEYIALFEVKSSPMVTYPLVYELQKPLLDAGADGPKEYRCHALVDVVPRDALKLFIPHRDIAIPLKGYGQKNWPFTSLEKYFNEVENIATWFSAWLELFDAYSIPKTERTGKNISLCYLVNGWGDEIDSNKTKPGLGRTDDIKKGTYQLLKFGAYYNDRASEIPVLGILTANLDPIFMRQAYLTKLEHIRWAENKLFVADAEDYRIKQSDLNYLYNALFTFNYSVINNPLLCDAFDLSVLLQKLTVASTSSKRRR
jgi:hypothetical protein